MMTVASTILALASATSAHIILTNPPRFPTTNGNGPIADNGSNYPCAASSYDMAPTEWKAGSTMPIKVMGGATHGGGSCQYSITPDLKPSRDTQFKVLHSVIGGCITSTNTNESPSDKFEGNPVVNVKLPEDLPAGKYTFSWSWLNKIGNREFYQNCAPITVTSSSKKTIAEAIGSLPDMYVMNVPNELNGGCSQPEGLDFEYPNPGKSVQKLPSGAPNYKGDSTLYGKNCAAISKLGAGNGKLGGGSPTKPEPTTPTVVTPPKNSGGVVAPSAKPDPKPQPQPQPIPPAAGSVPCTANGSIVCIGSSQFGLCNNGAAIPQALAAGTKCQGGAIVRRSTRAPRRHLARSHAANLI